MKDLIRARNSMCVMGDPGGVGRWENGLVCKKSEEGCGGQGVK